jgi:tetratricopeptide (TPR) repeat protein
MLLWLLLLLTPPASDAPPLPEILLRARDHLEASDRTAARRELTRALELYPESPAVYNFLGVVEAGDGHYEPAEQRFREAIRRAPHYTDARLNLGRLYQENAARDPEAVSKALAQYQAVLEYAPKHVEARFQSATLLQIRGEFDRSLEELERLPAADQERPAVIALRLADHAGKGDHEKADQAAEVLLQRAGVTELDLRSVLPALAEHNREDLAIRLLETMRARGWTSADDLRRLGLLHEEAGDLALGREARPEGVTLLLDLARVAHKQGDLRGALGYLAHARSLEPDNPYVHFSFGMVCVDMDLGAEAYDSLKEAVRLDPDNPSINYAFAAVALHRKDPSEAIPYFRKYAELKPEDPRGTTRPHGSIWSPPRLAPRPRRRRTISWPASHGRTTISKRRRASPSRPSRPSPTTPTRTPSWGSSTCSWGNRSGRSRRSSAVSSWTPTTTSATCTSRCSTRGRGIPAPGPSGSASRTSRGDTSRRGGSSFARSRSAPKPLRERRLWQRSRSIPFSSRGIGSRKAAGPVQQNLRILCRNERPEDYRRGPIGSRWRSL